MALQGGEEQFLPYYAYDLLDGNAMSEAALLAWRPIVGTQRLARQSKPNQAW